MEQNFELFLEHPEFKDYWISNLGRVLTTKSHKAKIMKFQLVRGYPMVRVRQNGKYVHKRIHRLVAEVFLPSPIPAGLEINHRDGNKANLRSENFEWVTRSENLRHAHRMGLLPTTFKKYSAGNPKLTEEQVRQIRQLNGSMDTVQVAKLFGVYRTTVSKIWKHKSWARVA
jgi:hypothetical protein